METELERQARIRANLQKMVSLGATHEDIQRYVESERITPEMERAREPVGVEGTIKGAIANAGEGVGFSLADELMGGLRGAIDPRISVGEGIDEVRSERDRFAAAHPKTALGLTLGGAVLPAVLTAGAAAGAGAPSVARVAATGAGAGAIAGYGSGEGGVLSGDRLARGTVGGIGGGVLGALAPQVLTAQRGLAGPGGQVTDDLLSRLAPSPVASTFAGRAPTMDVRPSGMPTAPEGFGDPAFRAAGRAIGDIPKARNVLAELERGGMGDEALAMNVGDDRTVRAVKAAANQPGSTAGQTVNSRLATQGGRLGEAVHDDLGVATGMGGVPGPVRLQQMQDALGAKVEAGYEAFRALPEVPLDPNDPAVAQFIRQYVDPVIENRRLSGTLSGESALSGRNVDAAFKNLQREVRGAQNAVSMGTKGVNEAQGREAIRDRVLAAIGETDPHYAELGRTYALDPDVGKVTQEAFDTGLSLPGKPVGQATVELGKTTPAGQEAMRAGHVTAMQHKAGERASNADLGDLAQFRDVARAAVGTRANRQQFIELHGQEKYDALLNRLLPKIKAAAQNAAARGNSTTTKQLLDALAFGDDATMDALGQLMTGSPQGAVRTMVGKAWSPMDRAYRLGVGKTAGETADLLTTKGAPQIKSLLDYLQSSGVEEAARKKAVAPVSSVAARSLTSSRRER